jgi:probable HAF family extracellular repeat protein
MRRYAIPHRGFVPPYWSVAHAINAAGQVVGGSGGSADEPHWARHAVLWDGGQLTELGPLPRD